MDSIFVAHCQWCRFVKCLLLNKLSWISQRSGRWSDVIWINNRHSWIHKCDCVTLSFSHDVMRFNIHVFSTSHIMWLRRRCCCSTMWSKGSAALWFLVVGSAIENWANSNVIPWHLKMSCWLSRKCPCSHSYFESETTEGWNAQKYSLNRWPSLEVDHWAAILRFLTTILFLLR